MSREVLAVNFPETAVKKFDPADNRAVLSWRFITIMFISVLLTIPSNLYKLPVNLPFDLEIYRIVGFGMLSLWFISLLIDKNVKLRLTPVDSQLWLMLAAVFVSFLVNMWRLDEVNQFSETLKALIFFSTYLMIFKYIISCYRRQEDIEITLKFIVVLAGFISVFAIIERITGFNAFRQLDKVIPILRNIGSVEMNRGGGIRVAGSVVHPIAFSAILAMIFPLALNFCLNGSTSRERFLYAFLSSLIVVTTILTGSRTGFMGLVTVAIVLLIELPNKRSVIVGILIPSFFLIHMLFPGALATMKIILSPDYINQAEAQGGRREDWPKIAAEFVKRPAFGLGYYTFDPKKYFFVDNQYLKLAVETGAFGLFSLAYFIYLLFVNLWRSAKKFEGAEQGLIISVIASAAVFVVTSATFDTLGFSQVPYMFFVISGLGLAFALNKDAAASLGKTFTSKEVSTVE